MTVETDDRARLIEAITREVMATLAASGGGTVCDGCGGSCSGGCAGQCAPRVAEVVAGGASRVSYTGRAGSVPDDLARYIDHTLLKPDATADDIDRLCAEAVEHRFASVCINPFWVSRAAGNLKGTGIPVASVIGFPFGATSAEIKAHEARQVIRAGAREIDMVINIGALKNRDFALVLNDIQSVVNASRPHPVKVILETSQLTSEEKIAGCALAKAAGAAFVKTSTGFTGGGATAEDVALMRKVVGDEIGVKASGGVRSSEDAMKMIAAGANRIGASASVAIVTGQKSTAKY